MVLLLLPPAALLAGCCMPRRLNKEQKWQKRRRPASYPLSDSDTHPIRPVKKKVRPRGASARMSPPRWSSRRPELVPGQGQPSPSSDKFGQRERVSLALCNASGARNICPSRCSVSVGVRPPSPCGDGANGGAGGALAPPTAVEPT